MKSFEEYLKTGFVKTRKGNITRVKSILEEADKRLKFFNGMPISEESANYIIENMYDVIRELIGGKCF